MKNLIIGLILGLAMPFLVDLAMFGTPTPHTITTESVHTARVWEDGSYRVEYKDGRITNGCKPEGLCND